MDDFELLCRMDEDKIMKTLKFIKDNVEYNNLFCLATFSTHGEQYYPTKSSFRKQSEVIFGHVVIFVIKNVQKTSDDKEKINALLNGDVPAEFLEKNVTILLNYKDICGKNIEETASFFKHGLKYQKTTSIPMFVTFYHNGSVDEIKFEKSALFISLKFMINTILGNFYQNAIRPEKLEYKKPFMELYYNIYYKRRKFSNQGPFHKWKRDITNSMEDLVELKHQLEKIFCDPNARDKHIDKIHYCLFLLQELIVKDYIPNQNSWITVDYYNHDGQKESIVLLKKNYAKKWRKQLVFTSKNWIAPVKKFCEDKVKNTSEKESITLEDYVWLYDENDNSNEPYLLIQNEKYAIGICEEIEKNSWFCAHLNKVQKIQYFCVKCKENVEMKNNNYACNCGVKVNFKKECLSCWRYRLSTLIDKNEDQWERVENNETGTNSRELELTIENNRVENEKLRNNGKTIEEEKQKLNAEITKLRNELLTHESEFNESLKGITTLTEENQQLKRKNGENEQTINNLQMDIAQLLENEKHLNDKLTKANENEKIIEAENRKLNIVIEKLKESEKIFREDNRELNAQVGELKNELKTHQSVLNKTHEKNESLTKENQKLKAENNGNEKTISNKKLKAAGELAKWTEAMEQKEAFVKPEQKAAYDHALECLKFMTNKHTLVLNKSELKTNIKFLSKNEFYDAIDEFLIVAKDGCRTLQKCKDIVKILEDE
uniref:Uncharacterized protein n=1 Tax=Panagrolaimus sp. JU765 TaxID=591449 RepID=A0AC34RMT2_9BILA